MALTRSMLKGMGLTEEQVGAIIDAHTETVDGLKGERDKYKKEIEKIPELEKKIDELENSKDDEDWQGKYEEEHKKFEEYKNEVSGKETAAQVEKAYRKLLVEKCGVGDKYVDTICNVTKFSDMKLDKDGNLVDADKLEENVKAKYSGFISSKETRGKEVETPPSGGGKAKTKEEILNIEDTAERQAAIAENLELFGH